MIEYSIVVNLYHGTSIENADAIMSNGYTELFLTTKKSRAIKYGNCIVCFWKKFEFKTNVDLKKFKDKLYKSKYSDDYIDYVALNNELRPLFYVKCKKN